MSSATYRVRRATLEDIGDLTEIWRAMRFPADELAKRITEFQVAETAEGVVLGAVGLQILEKQGRIHSEGFRDFSVADYVRPLLWDRLNSVAVNHGLLRLWTQEEAPFWAHSGLVKANADALARLPAVWQLQGGNWLTLKLRDELETVISVDREFALFMESEKQRTQKAFQQAKVLKLIATLLAVGLLIVVLVVGFKVFQNYQGFPGR